MLDAGDGHRVFWECSGNPNGRPALYVHGGPGSACGPGVASYFNPQLYRVVLFHQRGCGRSTPLASEPDADLRANTTQHLIEDMEQLRQTLGIERWTLLGGSWGTTLALAYAQKHPERVDALVLAAVTTTSRREVEWVTQGVGRVFPREWERFAGAIPPSLRNVPIVDAYAAMVFDTDAAVRERAAREWCAWEDAHVSLSPGNRPNPRFDDPVFRLGFARLVTHYWKNAAFLEEEQLLKNASVLNGIRGELIHGRYDVSSPLETAWQLSKAWRTSTLRVLDDAGHGGDSFIAEITAALERVAR
jgi:proline iminopeptidase